MASYVQIAPRTKIGLTQIFHFIRAELAPRPGMYSTVARIVLTLVLTFVMMATFRMPYAAITLYSIFIIDRSSRRATVLAAVQTIVAITLGVLIGFLGVLMFAEFPLLSFAYYALELFVAIFLVRTTRLQGPALNLSVAIYIIQGVWEPPYPPGPHIEQTLWVWLTLCLGFLIAAAVDLAFVRENPIVEIQNQLAARLRALSSLYSAIAVRSPESASAQQSVLFYAGLSTASIRHRISSLRTSDRALYHQLFALNAVTALVARLIDVSATIDAGIAPSPEESRRIAALAAELNRIEIELSKHKAIVAASYQPSIAPSTRAPALPELEHTALLIPTAFCTPPSREEQPVGPDIRERASIFLPDAFTNPGYLRFALKTTIAAMLCYVIYSALDWPGLATSVLTCIITALNTVGATKQKQVLRLLGASFGGLIALGSIIFLLPEIDSITAVTVLVAVVSAFGAWVSLASTRLAYFGLQTALAFYLAFIQDYTATTDLAPARDRALGVLLGLAVMWLVFDNLWPASAAKHMQRGLARNLRWLAELVTATDIPDRAAAIHRVRNLRDRIQGGMATVHGHADSVLFEIGSRDRKWQLTLRDAVLRLQATLRTLFVVEIAICQYRTQIAPGSRPPEVVEAQRAFDHALAERLLDAARSVDELQHVPPDERLSAAFERFEESIGPWVQSLTDPWQKTQVSGIRALMRQTVTLAESLGQHWTSTS